VRLKLPPRRMCGLSISGFRLFPTLGRRFELIFTNTTDVLTT
jgi:hypothetical protein